MKIVDSTAESPILVVSNVELELQRLSDMCHLLAQLHDRQDTVDLEAVGHAMGVIRDILDAQVKALEAIQWPKGKAVRV